MQFSTSSLSFIISISLRCSEKVASSGSCHFSRENQRLLARNERLVFVYLCLKQMIHCFKNYKEFREANQLERLVDVATVTKGEELR